MAEDIIQTGAPFQFTKMMTAFGQMSSSYQFTPTGKRVHHYRITVT